MSSSIRLSHYDINRTELLPIRMGSIGNNICCKKFHKYIYGRQFILVTDRKPLMTILSPKKGIPTMAATRLRHWAITLASYSYTMEFKYSKENGSANALSRLLCPTTEEEAELDFHLNEVHDLPVTAKL